jgi:hypothetical protein
VEIRKVRVVIGAFYQHRRSLDVVCIPPAGLTHSYPGFDAHGKRSIQRPRANGRHLLVNDFPKQLRPVWPACSICTGISKHIITSYVFLDESDHSEVRRASWCSNTNYQSHFPAWLSSKTVSLHVILKTNICLRPVYCLGLADPEF